MRRRIVRDKSCVEQPAAAGQQGESGSTASDEVKGNERDEEEEDEEEKVFSSLSLSFSCHISLPQATLSTRKRQDISIKQLIGATQTPCQPQRFKTTRCRYTLHDPTSVLYH